MKKQVKSFMSKQEVYKYVLKAHKARSIHIIHNHNSSGSNKLVKYKHLILELDRKIYHRKGKKAEEVEVEDILASARLALRKTRNFVLRRIRKITSRFSIQTITRNLSLNDILSYI